MQELIQHAQDNVWCNTRVDRYINIELSRVSEQRGYAGFIPEPYGSIPLPTADSYQVFTLAALRFSYLGYPNYIGDWVNLAAISTNEGIETSILTARGQHVPPSEVYLRYGVDGSLLVVIKRSEVIDWLLDTELRFTSYRNPNAVDGAPFYTNSRVIGGEDEALAMYNEFLTVKELGPTTLYINGYIVSHTIHPSEIKFKDSFHYECRTYGLEELMFPIADLETFNSTLDSKRRYLIHLPNHTVPKVYFFNDLDLSLLQVDADGKKIGINIYGKGKHDIRMVTHHDIAINAELFDIFANAMPDDFVPSHIGISIKSGGLGRTIHTDVNYIKELYKLPDDLILSNLITDTNVIPEWNAAHLELSAYNRIMEREEAPTDVDEIVEAYGYNGVARIIARSPLIFSPDKLSTKLPVCLAEGASFITYNKRGELLTTITNQASSLTVPADVRCADALAGQVGNSLDITHNSQVSDVLEGRIYRYLKAKKVGGVLERWEEANIGDDYFIANGRVTWFLNLTGWDVIVMSNYSWPKVKLTVEDDRLSFDLDYEISKVVGFNIGIELFGYIELWLNDKRLVQGIDYEVIDNWLHVFTKEHYAKGMMALAEADFQVLFSGFSDENLMPRTIGDVGFVRLNKLSANHEYNLIDGLNGTFIYNGGVFLREDVVVQGLVTKGSSDGMTLVNAKPYQFFSRVITTPGLTWDLKGYHQKATDMAKVIEDYFTKLYPPAPHPITPIKALYPLVSITLHRLILDMVHRRLKIRHGRITDDELRDSILSNYTLEIANDKVLFDWGEDRFYVEYHPHALYYYLDLTPAEYDIVRRANAMLFNGKVNISRFLRIGRET